MCTNRCWYNKWICLPKSIALSSIDLFIKEDLVSSRQRVEIWWWTVTNFCFQEGYGSLRGKLISRLAFRAQCNKCWDRGSTLCWGTVRQTYLIRSGGHQGRILHESDVLARADREIPGILFLREGETSNKSWCAVLGSSAPPWTCCFFFFFFFFFF